MARVALDMRLGGLRAGLAQALDATLRPAVLHVEGDLGVELDGVGIRAIAEALVGEAVALGKQGGSVR
ncbi:hypothetical protein D3C83_184030 [compost metagenome]